MVRSLIAVLFAGTVAFAAEPAPADVKAYLGVTDPDSFVEVPLERTYQAASDTCPSDFSYLVEHGKLPGE